MVEMFEYSFMIKAFLAGIIISILAPTLGTFIVIRRYSMITDTLAHSSLLGVAIGILFGIYPIITALISSIIIGLLIEYLRSYKNMYSDSILAIFLSGALAFAIVIVSISGEFNNSLFSYLFGTLLAITDSEIYLLFGFSIIALVLIFRNYHNLQLVAFDEDIAKVSGVNTSYLNFMLIILIAITVVLSIKIIGALLIGAITIIPVSSALQFKRGFSKTIIIAILLALISVLVGLTLSYYLSIPSGASVVIVSVVLFILSLIFNRKNG